MYIFCQHINAQQIVLYPTIFIPYEWASVSYNNLHERTAYPSGISSSKHDINLNFAPVLPRVK